jgi:ferredoxin-NADP reductase
MFTETLAQGIRHRVMRSPLVSVLAGPHGVDSYTELVDRAWTDREARATVVDVSRSTPRSVTLTLEPNARCARARSGFRAGQYLNVTVEIGGRRHTRCYSPANAEGARFIELTIGRHDSGLVSSFLCDRAHRGMVVGIGAVAGDFTLDRSHRRVLFVSGGSGITPVMSMLRTLRGRGDATEIAFVHYARRPEDACYADELASMTDVRVLHGYTRSGVGDLDGYVNAEQLNAAMVTPDAVYVCGPPALVDAVRACHPDAVSESFVPAPFTPFTESSGGRVVFADTGVTVDDDGRPLLDQAESAGLNPQSGCRMGICHTCTRRKTRGSVKSLVTGAVSTADAEDVQICVSVPVGDVEIAL